MSRRPSGPWLISVALHIVLGAGLLYVISRHGPLDDWWKREKAPPAPPAERIGFISVPQGATTTPGRSGGDGRPVNPSAKPPAPIVAPREVPTGVPPAPAEQAPVQEGGTGPVIGEGGPTAGIRPSYDTPRLFVPPEGRELTVAPRAGKPTADEISIEVRRRLGAMNDSIAALPPTRKPGDWTVEKNGRKYGMDQKNIYLGPVTIPNALLALLPLNGVQGNPTEIERARYQARVRADIDFQAQKAVTDESFKEAVKRIRERKERERREAQEHAKTETEKQNAPVP